MRGKKRRHHEVNLSFVSEMFRPEHFSPTREVHEQQTLVCVYACVNFREKLTNHDHIQELLESSQRSQMPS